MSVWLNAVSTSIVLIYVMLITPNTCLKWSVVADKPLYLVFKSNHWFDLWLVGLPPTGCRSKVDLIHTDPNQASRSGQTYRFRSQSPVGQPMFSFIPKFISKLWLCLFYNTASFTIIGKIIAKLNIGQLIGDQDLNLQIRYLQNIDSHKLTQILKNLLQMI